MAIGAYDSLIGNSSAMVGNHSSRFLFRLKGKSQA